MSAFLTPCRHPACGTATRNDSGYCDACEPKATQERNQRPRAKRSKGGAGYDVRHRRWRRRVLAADPFCRWPLGDGRLCPRPAMQADHVVPIAEWEVQGGSQYDLENGQGLCREHHGVKTQEERKGVYFDTRGFDMKPTISFKPLPPRERAEQAMQAQEAETPGAHEPLGTVGRIYQASVVGYGKGGRTEVRLLMDSRTDWLPECGDLVDVVVKVPRRLRGG